MGQWPRDDRREAAAVVLVERTALSGVAGLRISREDAGYLRHCTVVPRRMRYHVARQKSDAAAINAIVDPHGGDRRLLPPLHQNLYLAEAHDNVLRQHLPTVHLVLLTGAPLVATLRPDDLYHDAGRMRGGRRILGGRLHLCLSCLPRYLARRLAGDSDGGRDGRRRPFSTNGGAEHLTLHFRPSILGESAGAAPSEAARGGGHGVSCLCCVSACSYFFTFTHAPGPKPA